MRNLIIERMQQLFDHQPGGSRWTSVRTSICFGEITFFPNKKQRKDMEQIQLHPMNELTLNKVKALTDKDLINLFELVCRQSAKQY